MLICSTMLMAAALAAGTAAVQPPQHPVAAGQYHRNGWSPSSESVVKFVGFGGPAESPVSFGRIQRSAWAGIRILLIVAAQLFVGLAHWTATYPRNA